MTTNRGESSSRPTQVRWVVMGLLVLGSFVAYLLRTNFSIAGDAMMTDLGLDKVQLGMVMAAFAWGYGLFQFPGGLFGDRFGPRFTLAVIALGWFGLTLAIGLLPRGLTPMTILGCLLVLRFLMGIAQAPFFPVAAGATIARWFPAGGWALPNGLMSTGLTLGAAASAPIVAWLTQQLGWRLGFVAVAPTALGLSLLWWWYSRDDPATHPGVNRAEHQLITQAAIDPRPPSEVAARESWRDLLRCRDLWLLAGSYFCMNYVFYIFFNWFFIYLLEVRGFTAVAGGFAAALPWLMGAAAGAIGGWWCDRLSRRWGLRWGCRVPALVGLTLAAILLVLGAVAGRAAVAVLLLALCFASTQLTEGAYWSATIAIADRHAAGAAGMLNTGGNLVGGFGALTVPLVAESFGWVPALSTGSVFAVLGALAWLLIRADRPMLPSTETAA